MNLKSFFIAFFMIVAPHSRASAAVLHFYKNPRLPQLFFHVSLEFQGLMYEADPRFGGHAVPLAEYKKHSDVQIYINDALIDTEALSSQIGLKFDFDFIWGNDRTYCSELVGLTLKMQPRPMSFAGTHYLDYYPDWIYRQDPGISPEQIYDFGILHGSLIQP